MAQSQGRRDRRSTSIDVLRLELENVNTTETVVPVRSPAVEEAPTSATGAYAGTVAPSRFAREDSPDEANHVTFSDTPQSSMRQRGNAHSHPPLETDLYPIESRVEDTEAAKKWRQSREQHAVMGLRRSEVREAAATRSSRVSFTEPTVITRPRHRRLPLGGIEENVIRAAQANATIAHAKDWVAQQKAKTKRLRRARTTRLRAKVAKLYKKWILEGLLRQRPLPPSADGRHILLNPGLSRRKDGLTDERRGKPYISNFIRSSRYTLWSFLPKQLFFQFSKLANAYFLTIGILQMIPGLSTTGSYTTIGPLIAFVALSMAKEGWDDYRRYKLDKLENRTEACILDPDGSMSNEKRRTDLLKSLRFRKGISGTESLEMDDVIGRGEQDTLWSQNEEVNWSKVQWQDIRVGDVIRLRRDENVPADIVLLHASGPNGVAYIETMALDGETNLKSKQACPLFTKYCSSVSALGACAAEVVSEDPNLDLYNYEGKAIVNGEAMPLTLNQVVYRGSTLRNTAEAIGVVVNSGEECKIRMNASKNVHAKAPAMQFKVNKIVILLVFFVVILSVGCSVGNILWVQDTSSIAWYLNGYVVSFGQILIGFVIVFNTLIPLSLYVSLEIVKIGQVMLLRDIDLYDTASNTPMVANTTTILEDLGQVSYVFSDKTGTLTENLMQFRKMSVAGTAWLHDMDVRRDAKAKVAERADSQVSGAVPGNLKGKHAVRPSMSTVASDILEDRLGDEQASQVGELQGPNPTRPSPVWSNHPQTQLNTEDLLKYLQNKPETAFSKKARQFILCIALCHTCLPEKKADGHIEFQAASPDELALVEAARDLGILLIDRPAQNIRLQFSREDGSATEETYEVLDVIEFSSRRKRMSIIIRMPDGRVCVFSKGADSTILPRLKLNKLAMETASVVDRRASLRKSMEQEKALRKLSLHSTRNSTSIARATRILGRKSTQKRSASMQRRSLTTEELDARITSHEHEFAVSSADNENHQSPRVSIARGRSIDLLTSPVGIDNPHDGMVDETIAVSDRAVFERCFQHIDDFASEGLRTLLFAYRYIEDSEYAAWKSIYHNATTSLVNRQEQIEAAAEIIEQNFDLAGATAIEDKLQQGVPETIDKLRRANIKVWMLTGDKRETAINIAHSARICKPYSEVYILDATEGSLQDKIAVTLADVGRGMVPHSVIVIDGHTLSIVEEDDSLRVLLFDLVARVDSVICCRASPAQKATLVKCIRNQVPSSLTLAIGDGANDIAMIQASHVGIGISGREGLQAARISDYSIAQFRFLQKLLFVHGRWNYIRTGKYILGTFWKEMLFYLVQALYQRYNGYTGTSLYESTSLAVFNTLFTSLAVILLGMFEQDLRAETLLAVPELYTYGQENKAFNFRKYIGWTIMAVVEAVLIYFGTWGIFSHILYRGDNGLYAMGDLAFTVCVVFINIKLLILELHNKTIVIFIGFFISVAGWFLWNLFLAAIFARRPSPYAVRDAFTETFGRDPVWWLTVVMVLAMVILLELMTTAMRRIFWPQDQDLMQEAEKVKGVLDVMSGHAAELGEVDSEDDEKPPPSHGGVQFKFLHWSSHPRRRPSKKVSGDIYVAPPFTATPLGEGEGEGDPMDEAGARIDCGEGGKQKKSKTTMSMSEVNTDMMSGAGGGSQQQAQEMMIVQSPVEMSSSRVAGKHSTDRY